MSDSTEGAPHATEDAQGPEMTYGQTLAVARAEVAHDIEHLEAEIGRLRGDVARLTSERDRAREEMMRYFGKRKAAEARVAELEATVARVRARVTKYRTACNDDLRQRWNDTDHGMRLACDYVLTLLDGTG